MSEKKIFKRDERKKEREKRAGEGREKWGREGSGREGRGGKVGITHFSPIIRPPPILGDFLPNRNWELGPSSESHPTTPTLHYVCICPAAPIPVTVDDHPSMTFHRSDGTFRLRKREPPTSPQRPCDEHPTVHRSDGTFRIRNRGRPTSQQHETLQSRHVISSQLNGNCRVEEIIRVQIIVTVNRYMTDITHSPSDAGVVEIDTGTIQVSEQEVNPILHADEELS